MKRFLPPCLEITYCCILLWCMQRWGIWFCFIWRWRCWECLFLPLYRKKRHSNLTCDSEQWRCRKHPTSYVTRPHFTQNMDAGVCGWFDERIVLELQNNIHPTSSHPSNSLFYFLRFFRPTVMMSCFEMILKRLPCLPGCVTVFSLQRRRASVGEAQRGRSAAGAPAVAASDLLLAGGESCVHTEDSRNWTGSETTDGARATRPYHPERVT